MTDLISLVGTFLTGLTTGVISGLAIQWKRFKDNLKMEKIKRLLPYLEHAYPIVERLKQHSDYANNIQLQNNDDDLNEVLGRVYTSLDEFEIWFTGFKEDGLIRELDSIDKDLLNHFVGLFNYASQNRRHGPAYISQRIEAFSKYCVMCEQLLAHRLME